MLIKITIQGEPDTLPFTKTFQYQGCDDPAFIAAVKRVKEMLDRSLRINLNDVLLVLTAFVINSLKEGKNPIEIQKGSQKILSSNHVMIGVPEMLQKLKFDVWFNDKLLKVLVEQPILIQNHMSKLV